MIKKNSIKLATDKLPQFKFSNLLLLFLVFAGFIFLFFQFSELENIAELFSRTKWYFLVLALFAQFLALLSLSQTHKYVFKLLNLPKLSNGKILKLTTTVLFLNFTIPSVGIAGDVWLFKKFKDHGANEGSALLSIVIEVLAYYVSFLILLFFSVGYIFFAFGEISEIIKYISFGTAVVLTCFIFYVYVFFKNKKKAHRKLLWLTNKLDPTPDGSVAHKRIDLMLKDFYSGLARIMMEKKKLLVPLLFQMGKFLADGFTIFFIILAFDKYGPYLLCLVSFAVGKFAGIISALPGGIGAVEGSMTLILNLFFKDPTLSVSVMLIYRFFSYWIYIPFGIAFFKTWKKDEKDKKQTF